MLTLYAMPSSGNSYKVRLLLHKLSRPYLQVDCENNSPEWQAERAKAPFGKLPFLKREDGSILPESNAILWSLAEGTRFLPSAPQERADALAWMFWEQTRHEPVVAVRQSLRIYPERAAQATPARMAELLTAGQDALAVMERHLCAKDWFAGPAFSVADIALYAYTHSAEDRGGFTLGPATREWLARCAQDPRHIPLTTAQP